MKRLHLFNCSNDMALAVNAKQYFPPKNIQKMENDLALLPKWWAEEGDAILTEAGAVVVGQERTGGSAIETENHVTGTLRSHAIKTGNQAIETLGSHAIKTFGSYAELKAQTGNDFMPSPWGWSKATAEKFRRFGVPEGLLPDALSQEGIRELSSRRFATNYMKRMLEDARKEGWRKFIAGEYMCTLDTCNAVTLEQAVFKEKFILKSLWSSSGRGVYVARNGADEEAVSRMKSMIKAQGGVAIDKFYDKLLDFALEYFVHPNGTTDFLGFSVFRAAEEGRYGYNIVADQRQLRNMIDAEFPKKEITDRIIAYHKTRLNEELSGRYSGAVGVDMLIAEADGERMIHPCIEINLRMNMGIVALQLQERLSSDEIASVSFPLTSITEEGFSASVNEGKFMIHYKKRMTDCKEADFIHALPETAIKFTPPEKFTYPFHYTPHPLCVIAAEEVKRYLRSRTEWEEEIEGGKMFGVLITRDRHGELKSLAAFSGILAGKNKHRYFVPPVYDLQNPDGKFRREESEINAINERIRLMETGEELKNAREELRKQEVQATEEVNRMKNDMKRAKARRDARRSSAFVTAEEENEMIRESQFMKAELKRQEREWEKRLETQGKAVERITKEIDRLKEERKSRSAKLQRWLFEQFRMLNAYGEEKNLVTIFEKENCKVPPAGSGECCAPKLLQAAYKRHLAPVCMAEFWLGRSPKEEIRHSEHFYPSCRSKCKPILAHMLQGLDVEENPLKEEMRRVAERLLIIYEDEHIVVINKPAGMLSVPGNEDAPSVYDAMRERFPHTDSPLIVHRLDMDTSGIMLIAKTKEAHKSLQEQFIKHEVEKRYTALLCGEVKDDEGEIDLPICADPYNRPRQMVSRQYGKKARTLYSVQKRMNGKTLISFYPQTGRTHQLRMHSAHPEGLGCPILGDKLYGNMEAERMFLHADSIVFRHPATHEILRFESKADFLEPKNT